MIAYLDSSILLRILMKEPQPLAEWETLTRGISSRLLTVECHRSLDRLWQQGRLTQEHLTEKHALLGQFLPRLDLKPLDEHVLRIAAQPFPAALGTLDAIHLATAIIHRDQGEPFLFATHDRELARAATAMHFEVIG